jgi:dihydrofolate synthase/folylpolyglutamate synthase
MDANELQTKAARYGLNGSVFASVKKAKQAAMKNAAKQDLIFIGGSTFVVAEAI